MTQQVSGRARIEPKSLEACKPWFWPVTLTFLSLYPRVHLILIDLVRNHKIQERRGFMVKLSAYICIWELHSDAFLARWRHRESQWPACFSCLNSDSQINLMQNLFHSILLPGTHLGQQRTPSPALVSRARKPHAVKDEMILSLMEKDKMDREMYNILDENVYYSVLNTFSIHFIIIFFLIICSLTTNFFKVICLKQLFKPRNTVIILHWMCWL